MAFVIFLHAVVVEVLVICVSVDSVSLALASFEQAFVREFKIT